MSEPHPLTRQLYNALVEVESTTGHLVHELTRLQEWLSHSPCPSDLGYRAPPTEDAPDSTRQSIAAIRAEALRPLIIRLHPDPNDEKPWEYESPSPKSPWFDRFDSYHRIERVFRRALLNAKLLAGQAGSELDRPGVGLLERESTEIREALQNLGGVVPSTVTNGEHPPMEKSIPGAILEQLVFISQWINRLRALILPEALSPARLEGEGRDSDTVKDIPGSPATVRIQCLVVQQADGSVLRQEAITATRFVPAEDPDILLGFAFVEARVTNFVQALEALAMPQQDGSLLIRDGAAGKALSDRCDRVLSYVVTAQDLLREDQSEGIGNPEFTNSGDLVMPSAVPRKEAFWSASSKIILALGFDPETWNRLNGENPGGPHARFRAGDVFSKASRELLRSAEATLGMLAREQDRPVAESHDQGIRTTDPPDLDLTEQGILKALRKQGGTWTLLRLVTEVGVSNQSTISRAINRLIGLGYPIQNRGGGRGYFLAGERGSSPEKPSQKRARKTRKPR